MNSKRTKIAILGATGHIAKAIIYNFKDEQNFELYLFTRSTENIKKFLKEINVRVICEVKSYNQLLEESYDVLINCVGIGDPAILKSKPEEIFFITEKFDSLSIDYLIKHNTTQYINFSSGAVYGVDFDNPVNDSSNTTIPVNQLTYNDFYRIAKINSEAKHRALYNFNIIDLRIFGFYSQFIDLGRPFLLSDIISSIKTQKVLTTDKRNIIRDYIHPKDLAELLKICIKVGKLNAVFDVISKKPITKFEILQYFHENYKLQYHIDDSITISSNTGNKDNYFSTSKKISGLGFVPDFTSIDCLDQETKKIIAE